MFWGILSATEDENKLIIQNLKEKKQKKWNYKTIITGKIGKYQVLTMSTGIGKVKAASSVQYLIDHFPLKNIIFIGVAGAINPNQKVGDIIICQKTTQHDYSNGEDTSKDKKHNWLKSSPVLLRLAVEAGKKLNFADKIVSGSVITGDQAIKDSNRKKWLWKTFRADCVDMEAAAIAMVCNFNNIPFVIIRSISDHADENTSRDFSKSFPQVSTKPAVLAQAMLGEVLSEDF